MSTDEKRYNVDEDWKRQAKVDREVLRQETMQKEIDLLIVDRENLKLPDCLLRSWRFKLPQRDWIPHKSGPWGYDEQRYGIALDHASDRIRVLASASINTDRKAWLHVSVSRQKRQPTWDDLVRVRDELFESEMLFVKIIPPRSKYVNINPNVLHVFHCFDGSPLPEFSDEIMGVRTL